MEQWEFGKVFVYYEFHPTRETMEVYLRQVREAEERMLRFGAKISSKGVEGDMFVFVASGFEKPEMLEMLFPMQVSSVRPKPYTIYPH